MSASDHLANAVERACTDAVEAAALQHRIGDRFLGTFVDVGKNGGLVQISDPAILATLAGASPADAGTEAMVELVEADAVKRSVRFQVVGGDTAK